MSKAYDIASEYGVLVDEESLKNTILYYSPTVVEILPKQEQRYQLALKMIESLENIGQKEVWYHCFEFQDQDFILESNVSEDDMLHIFVQKTTGYIKVGEIPANFEDKKEETIH